LPSRCGVAFGIGALLLLVARAGSTSAVGADAEHPPQDSGVAGVEQMLRKLATTARLMHTTAHPDDEDGGMLALYSRGHGATVALMTLTRGEGGQNKTGPELFDSLGVLRTLELLASGKYYGVEQRFSRVADFGFSKNAAETFNKWNGKEAALADMVRVIREFRPDVIASRFQGAPRDGHGHHQAAGALTPERRRSKPVSRADSRRTSTVAGSKTLHEQHPGKRELHGPAGHRRVRSGARRLLLPAFGRGFEPPAFPRRGRIACSGRASVFTLQTP
jgi:LmbE family N-acetylglucosaminyl deacetylase